MKKKKEVDTEQLLAALIGNIPVRTTSQEPIKKKVTGKTVPLFEITDNENIVKKVCFLSKLRKLI